MISEALKNKVSSANQPLKIRGVIAGSTSGNTIYYVKPSIDCNLLGAKLTLLTNTETGTSSKKIVISKTTITDPDLIPDSIQSSTTPTITASDVSSSSLFDWTPPSNALTQTAFQPVASSGITADLLRVNPDASTSNAIKILIPTLTTDKVLTGVLEIELLPY